MEFENRDEAKNIINMRSVIKTVLFTSFFVVSIVVLRFFADQRIFPYGLMMGVLVFTMYLVKLSQNQRVFLPQADPKKDNSSGELYHSEL